MQVEPRDADAVRRRNSMQLSERLGRRVVDIGDRAGVDAQPPELWHARGAVDDDRGQVLQETIRVGVVERGVEAEHHERIAGAQARTRSDGTERAVTFDEHTRDRTVRATEMIDDRHHDREFDALLDSHDDDGHRRDDRDDEFIASNSCNTAKTGDVDEVETDHQDDRCECRLGQVLQRAGAQHQHAHRGRGHREVRELAAATGAVEHLSLGRTPVHDERAGDGCSKIRDAETGEIVVLVEIVGVLRCVGTRCRCALREHEDQDRQRSRGEAPHVAPGHIVGNGEARQASRHAPEHSNTVLREVREITHHDRTDHGDERTGDARADPLRSQGHDDHRHRHDNRGPTRRADVTQRLDEYPCRAAGGFRNAKRLR